MTQPQRAATKALLVTALGGAVLLGCTWLFGANLVKVFEIREGTRTISATGSARLRVRSDLVIWTASVTARGATLAEAWSRLSSATPRVRQFLLDHQVPEGEIVISAVTTQELHGRDQEGYRDENVIVGYRLLQTVEVTSRDIDRITEVSRQVTELIEQGIEIESSPPDYLFTGLQELRIRLVTEASRIARQQAAEIAETNDAHITGIASAQTGVVQLNAANETEAAWDGVRDTTSIEKDAFVVVRLRYFVE